jgi:hypothetical protein
MVDGNKSAYYTLLRGKEKPLLEAVCSAEGKLKAAQAASANTAYGIKLPPIPPTLQAEVKRLMDELMLLRNTFGLGGANCPSKTGGKCSGKGECTSSGCMCRKGWTGIDCDYNLATSGYSITKPAYVTTAYTSPPPIHRPPCAEAALLAEEASANLLNQIPSVADAINKENGVQVDQANSDGPEMLQVQADSE